MSDSYLVTALRKFGEENPFKKIVKTEISYNEDETTVRIFYDENGKTFEQTEIIKHPLLTDEEIANIKKRAKIYKWMDLDKAQFMSNKNEPDKVLIIYDDGWIRDIFVIDKFKGKAKRLVESKPEMDFKDLVLFSFFSTPIFNFYHDYINREKRFYYREKLDVNKRLFLLHYSSKYNGILPDDWILDYEKNRGLNYAELWKNDDFLPDINIKDPIIFDALIVCNAAEIADQERYLKEQQIHAEYRRICYNRIREKYRLKGLRFKSETKNTHYIYSVLKYYSELNAHNWFKIRIEKMSEIRSIPHTKIRIILQELVKTGVLQIDESTKPMSYRILS